MDRLGAVKIWADQLRGCGVLSHLKLGVAVGILCLSGSAEMARADPVSDRIYPAPREELSLAGLPAHARLVSVTTDDGLVLQGVTVAGRDDMPTLLVFHGNSSGAADAVRWMAPAIETGYGVVAAEYRGYSGNPGRPTARGLASDADAFLGLAKRSEGPVWIVGHSLGGGVALSLASRGTASVVVTIGTFTRLRDMTSGLTRAVVPDDYRNRDLVGDLTIPYYVVHGLADDVVPASHGQALHSIASLSNRTGASFVLLDADHRPDGDTIAEILEVIRAGDIQSGADRLPGTTKVIPFGASSPLNP